MHENPSTIAYEDRFGEKRGTMKIKGYIKILLPFLAALTVFAVNINAEEAYDFGQSDIANALPPEAAEILDELNTTPDNGGTDITAENIFTLIWEAIKENAPKPLAMLASVIAVIILCSVTESMQDGGNMLAGTFSTVGVLACSGIICTSFAAVMESAKTAIEALSSFLAVYIPAFAGIMAASGQTATAAAYNAAITVASQLITQLFSVLIFPLSSCIMGISIAGAINPDIKINSISEAAKRLINWSLGLLMAVFTGLLSVQGFVTAAADSVSMRAVKFTVAGAVPIVGGAVSEALQTVKSSMNLLKSTTGSFGIIASVAVMLPVVLSVALFRIALMISAAISDTFGTARLTALLRSGESVLAIVMAVMVCFWLLAVLSTAFMLAISGGTA